MSEIFYIYIYAKSEPLSLSQMSLKAVGVAGAGGDGKQPTIGERVRPLEKNDFLLALSRVKRTGESAAGFVDEYLNNKT